MAIKTWQSEVIETVQEYDVVPDHYAVQTYMTDEIKALRVENLQLSQALNEATKIIGELTAELTKQDKGAAPQGAKPGAEKPKDTFKGEPDPKWGRKDSIEQTLVDIFGKDRVVFLG